MWRASLVIIALSSLAGADPREQLSTQLTDQAAVLDKTIATVDTKLGDAETVRAKRLRAAYRLLRAPLRTDASSDDRMAAARRRAAARLLVDRDRDERNLLSREAALLRTAAERTVVSTTKLPTVTLPESLMRPARGAVVRKFGTILHEPTKATLSRRGIDIEVPSRTAVVAPADGTVRYAGPIRGLDQGVIIEHGDYFTVIAKLGETVVPVGAPVRRGDRVGRASRYRVYMELRVRIGPGGIPIDPAPLFDSSPPE